ncbi:hypothetical protein B0H13DRAFT_1891984 [Mycena leptocephala]|nr:hypothetical protein B0H13DRAFT_1891984 [Mycena leptocephala]
MKGKEGKKKKTNAPLPLNACVRSLRAEASSASERSSTGQLAGLDLGEVAGGGEVGLAHEGGGTGRAGGRAKEGWIGGERHKEKLIRQPALLVVRELVELLMPIVDPRKLEVVLSRPRHISAQRWYCQDRREGADCVRTSFSRALVVCAAAVLAQGVGEPVLLSERSLSTEQSEVERKVRVMLGSGWVPCTGWWEERTWGHDSGRQWKSKSQVDWRDLVAQWI